MRCVRLRRDGFLRYNGLNGVSSLEGNGSNGRNGTNSLPGLGGAIYNLGNLTLLNCALTNNNATGVPAARAAPGATAMPRQGYTGGNGGAGANGGAAYGGAVYTTVGFGTLFVSNCTFAGNSATGGAGGAGGAGVPGCPAACRARAAPAARLWAAAFIARPNPAVVVNSTFYGNTVAGGASAAGEPCPMATATAAKTAAWRPGAVAAWEGPR